MAAVELVLAGKGRITTTDIAEVITGASQQVTETGGGGQKGIHAGHGIAMRRCKQRQAALAGGHAGDGPAGGGKLADIGEVDCLLFQLLQMRHQAGKHALIQITAFQAFGINHHQVARCAAGLADLWPLVVMREIVIIGLACKMLLECQPAAQQTKRIHAGRVEQE